MSTLQRALEIASEAHAGQKDKNGNPYINHPLRVAASFAAEPGAESTTLRIIALLHDVVEDSPEWPLERLLAEGFEAEVIEAVDALTRRAGETYADFVLRAGENRLGRRVKLADLRDNMDLTRLHEIDDKAVKRLRRYLAAWQTLTGDASRV